MKIFFVLANINVPNFTRIWEIPPNTLVVDCIFPNIAAVKDIPSHML